MSVCVFSAVVGVQHKPADPPRGSGLQLRHSVPRAQACAAHPRRAVLRLMHGAAGHAS